MPVIKRKPPEYPEREEVLGRLVEELRTPGDRGQPLILEYPIGETDSFNVYVIWERWDGLSHRWREEIIREAFLKFDMTESGKIPIASGLTTEEATLRGLLPVRIEPVMRREGRRAPVEMWEAMIEEGASQTEEGTTLRFTSLEDAQAVFDRLQARFPGSFRLVEEQPALTD